MLRWLGFGSKAQRLPDEKLLLQGESNSASHYLTAELESLVDKILVSLGGTQDLMGEVLIAVPGVRQIFTLTLRPDTSVALYLRLRAGEGIAGKVLESGEPFAGRVRRESQLSRNRPTDGDVAHLYSTQSAIAVPLRQGDVTLGILNLESPRPDILDDEALDRLRRTGLLDQVVATLSEIKRGNIPEQDLVADQLRKMREKIAFAIDPADMTETYYQILRIAGQSVRPSHVSGGLILVRDAEQRLVQGAQERKVLAVRAARIGAFDSDLEWELQGQSIARRIMESRRGEVIPHAQADPDYRDSGTGLPETSELIVPLVDPDRDRAIGVIGLVSAGQNAFDGEDLRNLETVAEIAVYAVKRSEEYRRAQRQSEQLEASRDLLALLAPLFQQPASSDGVSGSSVVTGAPADAMIAATTDGTVAFSGQLTMEKIGQVRDSVCSTILRLACAKTHSEHAAFVLAQMTEGQQTYLVIQEKLTSLPVRQVVPTRWLSTEGISGQAFTQGTTIVKNDVAASAGPEFISYFEGVRSEIDAPLKIGDTVLGVLDIESNTLDHFTSEYVEWAEFLAEQAAFALSTIDRAVKTCIELAIATVSQTFDRGIAGMQQANDLTDIRNTRNTLIRILIDTLLPLAHAQVGRFLIALNAYANDRATVDPVRGRLFYLVSTDPSDISNADTRSFSLTDGVSGKAFVEQQQIVFNDPDSRPREYFYTNPDLNCVAGIFVPVWEGTQITAILDIESKEVGAFTPDVVRACQLASDLASKLVTAARLRILTVLRHDLRRFDIDILRQQTANLNDFMHQVLDHAAELSVIRDGWGTVVHIHPTGSQGAFTVERRFWATYAPGANHYTSDEIEHSALQYSIFIEALHTKQPVLVLDRRDQLPDEPLPEPWPTAVRSMICVPLFRPAEGETPDDLEAVAVLALAHPNPNEFSEFDKELLTLFAETVSVGLKNIALLQARKELMAQVRHDFSIGLGPLGLRMRTLKMEFDDLHAASDPQTLHTKLEHIAIAASQIERSVYLFNALVNWFSDFSDDDLEPESGAPALNVEAVIRGMKDPVEVLASANSDRAVTWDPLPAPIFIQGGENRIKLIRAAMFQLIDNAIKHGEKDQPVTVTISQDGSNVIFQVSSSGSPLPPNEWDEIFRLYYRGSNVAGKSAGSGIGLFQVREIAKRLGGTAYYRPRDPRLNVFHLEVPAIGDASFAQGA